MSTDNRNAYIVTMDSGTVMLAVADGPGEARAREDVVALAQARHAGEVSAVSPCLVSDTLFPRLVELGGPLPGDESEVSARLRAHIAFARQSLDGLRGALVDFAVERIVEAAERIAPDADSFDAAVSVGFPGGEHATLVAETAMAAVFRQDHSAIDAVRASENWDTEMPGYDADVAAYAIVRDALHLAEQVWTARSEPGRSPAP